jgi:hypothetical protein
MGDGKAAARPPITAESRKACGPDPADLSDRDKGEGAPGPLLLGTGDGCKRLRKNQIVPRTVMADTFESGGPAHNRSLSRSPSCFICVGYSRSIRSPTCSPPELDASSAVYQKINRSLFYPLSI